MKKFFLFALAVFTLLPSTAHAHAGLYHNYAGSGGFGFLLWLLVLVAGLLVYEKYGDTAVGLFGLYSGIEIPVFIMFALPDAQHLGVYGYAGIAIILIVNAVFTFLRRSR